MLNRKIEKLINSILEEFKVKDLPVPIEKIILNRGLEIKAYDLGENVSVVLVINNGKGTIGYNPRESKVRKRFTLAHELGHYEVHREDIDNGIFIDKGFKVEFRNQASSTGEVLKEQEANAFAAALLMPEKLLRKEIKNHDFDMSEDTSVKELAKLFNVSMIAMTYRIDNLNLF